MRNIIQLAVLLFIFTAFAPMTFAQFNYDDCTWIVDEGKLALDGSMYIEGLDQYVSMKIGINAKFIKISDYEVFAVFDGKETLIATHNGQYVYFETEELGRLLFDAAGENTPEAVKAFKDAVLALSGTSGKRASRVRKLFRQLTEKISH